MGLGDRGRTLQIGEDGYRPLRTMLDDVYQRYRRPIVVAETGTEGDGRAGWLRYGCDEVAAAQADGVPVEGVCLYPVTDYHTPGTPSYEENAEGYGLTRDTMKWFWNHYLSDPSEGTHPHASPLRAPNLSRLPPALVVTAEYDPLRDEGELYAEKLRAAGVPTVLTRYDGVNHGFMFWVGVVDKAGAAMNEACEWLRGIFTGQR